MGARDEGGLVQVFDRLEALLDAGHPSAALEEARAWMLQIKGGVKRGLARDRRFFDRLDDPGIRHRSLWQPSRRCGTQTRSAKALKSQTADYLTCPARNLARR